MQFAGTATFQLSYRHDAIERSPWTSRMPANRAGAMEGGCSA
jgi:hypothetical protein